MSGAALVVRPAVDLDTDDRFMAAALALGRRGLGRTAPNPSVGALVVRDGIVVGRGWTADGGRPHGEIVALAQAGAAAHGATLYVTLEPCSHHGRSPPCCEAVVSAGIARLVYAIEDPNPLVAGRGEAYCRAHGVAVTAGVGRDEATRDHRGHLSRMTRGRPGLTLKLAQTADGYVAGGPHDSRLAITGAAANGMVHGLRAMHDAIMVGIGTVAADDPLMTVRLPGVAATPTRVVLDSRLAISPRSRLFLTASEAPVLLVVAEGVEMPAPVGAIQGPEKIAVPSRDGHLDLAATLGRLAERGFTRVFSEGGPRIAEALLAQDLVDEVYLFTAPRPLGREGVPGLGTAARATLNASFELLDDRSIGIDRLRHYGIARRCSRA